MKFPSARDYALAVLHPQQFIYDPVLRDGQPILNGVLPLSFSGSYAQVFLFQGADQKRYACRCWTADFGGSVQLYEKLADYLKTRQHLPFANFELSDPGIHAGGRDMPVVRMAWVEGEDLKDYVGSRFKEYHRRVEADHEGQRAWIAGEMAQLRGWFETACAALREPPIAHGDLQPENMKVEIGPDGGRVVFIDYDTLAMDGMWGSHRQNSGVGAFQHPAREKESGLEPYDDHFSVLVLFITLLALERDPTLWAECGIETRNKAMIFTADDYLKPDAAKVLKRIEKIDPELKAWIHELRRACKATRLEDIDALPKIQERVSAVLQSVPAANETPFLRRLRGQSATGTAKRGRGKPLSAKPKPPKFFDDRHRRLRRLRWLTAVFGTGLVIAAVLVAPPLALLALLVVGCFYRFRSRRLGS